MRWMLLLTAGCGILEGVENPSPWPPCEVLSSAEVDDPAVAIGSLEPLADRLAATTGSFEITADRVQEEVPPEQFPGVLSLAVAGPMIAEERAMPEEASPYDDPARCRSWYRVPATFSLVLDGGLLSVEGPVELRYVDEDPEVVGVALGEDGGAWWDVDEVASGSLDRDHPDAGDPPHSISAGVVFADGVTATGHVSLYGDVTYDTDDGGEVEARSAWSWLDFGADGARPPR